MRLPNVPKSDTAQNSLKLMNVERQSRDALYRMEDAIFYIALIENELHLFTKFCLDGEHRRFPMALCKAGFRTHTVNRLWVSQGIEGVSMSLWKCRVQRKPDTASAIVTQTG